MLQQKHAHTVAKLEAQIADLTSQNEALKRDYQRQVNYNLKSYDKNQLAQRLIKYEA